ncbi:MAG: COG1615 family transporter, partial [Okeania sp. SIO2H7]|nr:COG1615 family transporter [Okeania sp. SIO2H7]
NSLSQGSFLRFSQPQQRHLHGLAGALMLTVAYSYFIDCFELLYSPRGVAYGASFTDVKMQLPANIFLSILALLIAAFLFWQAIFSVQPIQPYIELSLRLLGWRRRRIKNKKQIAKLFSNSYSLRTILTWYLIIAAFGGLLLPEIVQQVVVEPNELEREIPYIERSINFTRKAFNLDNIETKFFDPENQLSYEDIQDNQLTIENIRLWDTRPILATNKQLQQIRPYYEFFDADIDRYTVLKEASETNPTRATEKEQVIISARELNYEAVADAAQTWVNKYLVYTHGYGFTLSPVSKVGVAGLPEYFVKNIGPSPGLDSNTTLEVSERIRYSIPIGKPRIYYGELTNNEVMTSTKEEDKELDYPSGDTNVYNTYNGSGGIVLNNAWRRLLFAKYLKNWRMIFTNDFTTDTRVLFRRDIARRVRAIAPFLRYDSDPYLVVANPNFDNQLINKAIPNYLYWIIDAYTTSDRFPYSDPENHEFNYIRNSVKVVVDAYNGSVNFYYLDDPEDAIITTWRKVFPGMFKPLNEMPISLRSHIRYPVDLFSVQSERLLIYHMENPQVFYNREDVWRVPLEIYGVEEQPVTPYYLIMKLPEEETGEFILLLPFTPASRNNLIAWLAARSDGENYGKLLLYQFPKQRLVYGPEQIEALLNQDPEISQHCCCPPNPFSPSGAIDPLPYGNLRAIAPFPLSPFLHSQPSKAKRR